MVVSSCSTWVNLMPSIAEILQKVHTIPPLPAAVERLCQMAQDPEVDARDVAQVIATNEILTTRILRVTNSSFYGLSQRIGTVSQAIVILGLQGVKNLALGVTAFGFRTSSEVSTPLDRRELWRHGLAVASAARQISRLIDSGDAEETFTAGLLHDIGKVIFMEFYPVEYARVLEKAAAGGLPVFQLEEEVFGLNHATVGEALCQHWKMPLGLTRMVADHHLGVTGRKLAVREDRRVVAVYVADNLARIAQIGSDGGNHIDTGFLDVVEHDALPPQQLRQILLTLPEEVRKTEIFFNLAPAPESDRVASTPSTGVGVILADPKEREVVRLLLLTLGYTLLSSDEMKNTRFGIAGVVVDDSLPAELSEGFRDRGVLLLDYPKWKSGAGELRKHSQLRIRSLRAWLAGGLGGKKDVP